jgi:uncharacterized protein
MLKFLKEEIRKLFEEINKLDKKVIIIFLSVAVFQTISWYYTSRTFFKLNLYNYFRDFERVELIEFYYWFIGDFISFFLLPALIIKLWFKEKISRDYGVKRGDVKAGVITALFFFLIMLPFLWVVTSFPAFERVYPHIHSARENWTIFIIYEAGLLLYMFAWEFIWRGYMLFGLREKFGNYAIFIQTIPFVILHNGKPAAETLGAIIAGIALGVLAFRTGSMIYGFIIHGSVMFTIDLISVLRYKTGEYGTGINSLINILKNL